MIEAQSNIADMIGQLLAHAERSALVRADQRRRDLVAGIHPWRSAATLWPNFGQD